MKKLAILLTAIGLSATAPFAVADDAQLELMPVVGGAEITQFVREESSAPAIESNSAFYDLGTGGVATQ